MWQNNYITVIRFRLLSETHTVMFSQYWYNILKKKNQHNHNHITILMVDFFPPWQINVHNVSLNIIRLRSFRKFYITCQTYQLFAFGSLHEQNSLQAWNYARQHLSNLMLKVLRHVHLSHSNTQDVSYLKGLAIWCSCCQRQVDCPAIHHVVEQKQWNSRLTHTHFDYIECTVLIKW